MPGFRDIIGHESTKDHLKTAIASGHVSHAYLLTGDKGMGKKTLALAFAKALQCENLQEKLSEGSLPPSKIDSCGECRSCRQEETNNQPDIITWRYKKEASISVDDVRDLVSDIQIKPYASRYKVYILPDVQKMTREAQNALLKTLEEPPEYAVLILLTTSRDAMIETILSRCIVLPLRPVKDGQVRKYLMERHGIPDFQAEVGAAFAQGNIGRAKMLANSEHFNEIHDDAIQLLKYMGEMEQSEIVKAVKRINTYKLEINDYLDIIMIWFRDVLMYKATLDVEKVVFKNELNAIKERAKNSSYEGIERILEGLEKAKTRLKANVNFDLVMELLLLTIKEN